MLFTDQRTHFAPSKRHFHSGPSLLACFVRFSIVNCLKNRLPLLQKPASNDVFYTFLRRAEKPTASTVSVYEPGTTAFKLNVPSALDRA